MKNCSVGKSCHSTCIEKGKSCTKDLPFGAELSYLAERLKNKYALNEFGNDRIGKHVTITDSSGDSPIEMWLVRDQKTKGVYFEISVDGGLTPDANSSAGERLKKGIRASRLIKETAANLPEGTMLWGVAVGSGTGTEHSKNLLKWYSKMGFSATPKRVEGIIREGKITPP
jgi:hypothetical protein